MEYVLPAGDHVVYEWGDDNSAFPNLIGTIDIERDQVTIGENGGTCRIWNSDGNELSTAG